jgi:hypothetical protein
VERLDGIGTEAVFFLENGFHQPAARSGVGNQFAQATTRAGPDAMLLVLEKDGDEILRQAVAFGIPFHASASALPVQTIAGANPQIPPRVLEQRVDGRAAPGFFCHPQIDAAHDLFGLAGTALQAEHARVGPTPDAAQAIFQQHVQPRCAIVVAEGVDAESPVRGPFGLVPAQSTAGGDPDLAAARFQHIVDPAMRQPVTPAVAVKLVAVEAGETLTGAEPQVSAPVAHNAVHGVVGETVGGGVDFEREFRGLAEGGERQKQCQGSRSGCPAEHSTQCSYFLACGDRYRAAAVFRPKPNFPLAYRVEWMLF